MSKGKEERKTETAVSQSDLEQCVIKPCPFCGYNEPIINDINDGYDTYVECGFCGARGEWATGQHKEAEKIAIHNWNQRA